MAKKQTRRSISVSRSTYERLKAFCEANNVSMSQLVETRVNDFLGGDAPVETARPIPPRPAPTISGIVPPPPRPSAPPAPAPAKPPVEPPKQSAPVPAPAPSSSVPMTSAAARSVVEPPPPIIKPRQETAAPKPAEKRPDQIFTF